MPALMFGSRIQMFLTPQRCCRKQSNFKRRVAAMSVGYTTCEVCGGWQPACIHALVFIADSYIWRTLCPASDLDDDVVRR